MSPWGSQPFQAAWPAASARDMTASTVSAAPASTTVRRGGRAPHDIGGSRGMRRKGPSPMTAQPTMVMTRSVIARRTTPS